MTVNLIKYAWRNVSRRLKITGFLFLCVLASIFSVILAWTTYDTISQGVALSQERLSADVIVYPHETELSDISMLYTGVAQSVYMDDSVIDKLTNEYVESVSSQFYLQTLPTSGCCTTSDELRLVGIDWDSDFTVKSYLQDKTVDHLDAKQVIVGSNVELIADSTLILNVPVEVLGRLEPTGTYLDDSMILSTEQLKQMAKINFPQNFFGGQDPMNLTTSTLIRLKPDVAVEDYLNSVDDVDAKKIKVSSAANAIQNEVSILFKLLGGAGLMILFLGIVAIFSQINALINSQHKEMGYLRAIGVKKQQLYVIFFEEILMVVLPAGLMASGCAVFTAQVVVQWMHQHMSLPMLTWNSIYIVIHFLCGMVIALVIGIISTILPMQRVINTSPQELMTREGM